MPKTPLADAIGRIMGVSRKRLHQLIFDQFAAISDYSHKAFMQAHLSKGAATSVDTAVRQGVPIIKDGALAIDTKGGSFIGALQKYLGSTEEAQRFLMYVAGRRASELANEHTVYLGDKAVKTLKSKGEADRYAAQLRSQEAGKEKPARVKVKHTSRENLFDDKDIAALTSLNTGKMKNGKVRSLAYGEMHKELMRYQKAMLDVAEEAGVVNAESRKDWESDFYVPFYRVMENEDGSVNHNFGANDTGLMRQAG